jgi:membrane protease YdiL (CAAX protease family)
LAALAPVEPLNLTDVYLQLGLLLFTAAPSFLLFFATYSFKLREPWGHAIVLALLLVLNGLAFGPLVFPSTSALSLSMALLVGFFYYSGERVRLQWRLPGAIRVPVSSSSYGLSRLLALAPLIWIAIAEEFLYRGYLLSIPIARGWLTGPLSLAASSIAFGILHENFGAETVLSRMGLGFVLGFTVLLTGNLYFAVVAHAVYNGLTVLLPVQYIQMRRG